MRRRFDLIDLHAPFTEAFKFHNMTALSTIIGIGALTGIVSSIQMCAYGMTRMVMVMGRERLFPESMVRLCSGASINLCCAIQIFDTHICPQGSEAIMFIGVHCAGRFFVKAQTGNNTLLDSKEVV